MEQIIEDFPEYKINSLGQVFSRYKYKTSIITNDWRQVQPVLDKGIGYYLVTLVNAKTKLRKNQFIHRLLAKAFIPNPIGKPQVNHIDGNKQNNDLSNLEWVTPKENSVHAWSLGLSSSDSTNISVIQYDLQALTQIAIHKSLHDAGRDTGVCWQNIWKVCNGRIKSAGGFFWQYDYRSEAIL